MAQDPANSHPVEPDNPLQPNDPVHNDTFFLPDFCRVRIVLAVVVIGELLAFVLSLSPLHQSTDHWRDLSIISLFIQWVALSSAATLCIARPLLRRLNEKLAATLSYLMLLLITAILSEAAFWITKTMQLNQDISPAWHVNLLLSNLVISAIVSAVVLRYFYVQHQLKCQIAAELEARIQALQARIRPHFLFNSLNTIASLTRSQPEIAEQAIEDLADLFRQSLSDARHQVPIEQELELVRHYLHIENLRLGDRLKVTWDIDRLPLNALIPALSIQPLLENAIYHGVETLTDGGTIHIVGGVQHGHIHITVTNPLPKSHHTHHRKGNRMAMDNIRYRLEAFYGTDGTIRHKIEHNLFEVTLTFPYRQEQ